LIDCLSDNVYRINNRQTLKTSQSQSNTNIRLQQTATTTNINIKTGRHYQSWTLILL